MSDSAKVKDLDLLVGDPIRVKLQGEEYLLPADVPIATALRFENLADGETSDEEAARTLYREILKLFQVHQPDLESVPLAAPQLAGFFAVVYGQDTEPEADPTPPASTPSTKRAKSKSRSRSSGS